ncbi:MAG TPA: hypothetical protein VE053_00765 [Allosphingosinicella sp.]|nr:hypothetical protein [Allosphingosinicella sp.]
MTVLIWPLLASCQEYNNRTPTTIERIKDVENVNFDMIAFRTGQVSVYNPKFNEFLLKTRYSDSASDKIHLAIDGMGDSCSLLGLSASVDGSLVEVGSERKLMLNIEQISDMRALSEPGRKQLRDRSPTLNRAKMC